MLTSVKIERVSKNNRNNPFDLQLSNRRQDKKERTQVRRSQRVGKRTQLIEMTL